MSFPTNPMYYVEGTITRLDSQNRKSKAGKAFTIHTVDVNGSTIEVGFKQPFSVGDRFASNVEYAYKTYRQAAGADNTLGPIPNAVASPSRAPAAAGGGSTRSSAFPIPTSDGVQTAIMRQNALTNAVSLISNAGGYAGSGLGETVTNEDLKAVIKWRAELAIDIAYKFAAFSSGNLDAELFTASAAKSE